MALVQRTRASPGWGRSYPLLAWAVIAAIAMSTQFLFQGFIWRNWGVADIAVAWLAILRDRLLVLVMIAIAFGSAQKLIESASRWSLPVYLAAIIAGAAAGEVLLFLVGWADERTDLISMVGRVTRWTLVGGALAAIRSLWRKAETLSVAANEARLQAAAARRAAAAMQLEALHRQIEPHFLFNTLATIRRLHQTDGAKGHRLLERLLHYMSATLESDPRRSATLGDELDLCRAYLEVCASRMQGRLVVRCDVAADLLGQPFPQLALATLAENAIKHGISPLNGGTVQLSASLVNGALEAVVCDDGAGLQAEGGSGLGLANVADRLKLAYGSGAGVRLQANRPHGVRAVITIPLLGAAG
jgi:signal transduction histidine kinase